MKNKNIAFVCCVLLSVALSVLSICLHFISFDNEKDATSIFNECLYNIVEVKAKTDGIGESFGTGEILSSNGRIITNSHVVTYTRLGVVNEFEKYYIRFAYEDEYREVRLEKYNTELDLAVLYFEDIKGLNIKPIKCGNSSIIESGDNVYAVGNASNYGIGIFQGIVSIPLVNIELDGLTRAVIQCDLTIAAGNSGGALLDKSGEIIGVTTFRTKDMSGNVIYGIVYCIPINTVLEYINE